METPNGAYTMVDLSYDILSAIWLFSFVYRLMFLICFHFFVLSLCVENPNSRVGWENNKTSDCKCMELCYIWCDYLLFVLFSGTQQVKKGLGPSHLATTEGPMASSLCMTSQTRYLMCDTVLGMV